jgi:hypothetical protein
MSLSDYAGGGGDYLGVKDIEEGMKARITGGPYIGEKTFGEGEKAETKMVCEFPMVCEFLMEREGEPRTWSAGKNAAKLLIERLGPEFERWSYPVEGHFEFRKWSTSRSSGIAAHFIPDGDSNEDAKKLGGKVVSGGKLPHGTTPPSKTVTSSPQAGASIPGRKSSFVCKTHPNLHFSTRDSFVMHLEEDAKA